jgi:hypothetical protein
MRCKRSATPVSWIDREPCGTLPFMGAYLISDDLPFVLHFADLEPTTVAVAAERWMREGAVINVGTTAQEYDTGRTYIKTLLNFRYVRFAGVTSERPDVDKPIITIDFDLEDL